MLDSPEVKALKHLIRDSFRIRENHSPVYVDIGDNLQRFSSAQQQVLFGRRGSGKSCLQVHFLRQAESSGDVLAIYLNVDEVKRLGFPDVLIRILLSIFEKLPGAKGRFFGLIETSERKILKRLRLLLDEPDSAHVSHKDVNKNDKSAGFKGGPAAGGAKVDFASSQGSEITKTFESHKLDFLERHLADYKSTLVSSLKGKWLRAYVLVDDFYLIQKDLQPYVVDYLHKLLRGTNAYLKLGTIRHRTSLRVHHGHTIGVELGQDVEEISLDKTFEDFESTNSYLHSMLSQMATECDAEMSSTAMFSGDGVRALTLASGGVPRDFLTIFVAAIDLSVQTGKTDRLTPKIIYKAASMHSYKSKLANIQEEAGYDAVALDRVFRDLVSFCLKEKKKTAFLVSHEDARKYPEQHELLQQLMDFKLIHVISQNTSAASGREGRFVAYTLDFSIFMEPRRRGIELVEFWKIDAQRRPVGVREAPDYPLSRASQASKGFGSGAGGEVQDIVDSLEIDETAVLPETGP